MFLAWRDVDAGGREGRRTWWAQDICQHFGRLNRGHVSAGAANLVQIDVADLQVFDGMIGYSGDDRAAIAPRLN